MITLRQGKAKTILDNSINSAITAVVCMVIVSLSFSNLSNSLELAIK